MKIRNIVACAIGMAIIGASSITVFAGQKYVIGGRFTADEEEYNRVIQAFGSADMRHITDNEERARLILEAQVDGRHGISNAYVFDDCAFVNTGKWDYGSSAYRIDGVWWGYARVPQAKGDSRLIWIKYMCDNSTIAEIVTELPVGAWSNEDEREKEFEEIRRDRAAGKYGQITNIKDIEW